MCLLRWSVFFLFNIKQDFFNTLLLLCVTQQRRLGSWKRSKPSKVVDTFPSSPATDHLISVHYFYSVHGDGSKNGLEGGRRKSKNKSSSHSLLFFCAQSRRWERRGQQQPRPQQRPRVSSYGLHCRSCRHHGRANLEQCWQWDLPQWPHVPGLHDLRAATSAISAESAATAVCSRHGRPGCGHWHIYAQ